MVKQYVFKEPIIVAGKYNGNLQELIADKDVGLLWLNLLNERQAYYNKKTGIIDVELPNSRKYTINPGDIIVYSDSINPPIGGGYEIVRVEDSNNFFSNHEVKEDRNYNNFKNAKEKESKIYG